MDPPAAEAFASDPGRWLGRLENGRDAEGEFRRRFLVRACYLNPSAFARFRPFFTRAGFRVVDCPSLTQQGKSSADINMALDAVDALSAPTRYDEFVIVSADADFTPLALRCRAADRRVTIITAGPAASAYRAVADAVLTADDLAEILITPALTMIAETAVAGSESGQTSAEPLAISSEDSEPTSLALTGSSGAVLRLLRSAAGPVVSAALAQTALRVDSTLPTSAWDGHGTFAAWLAKSVPEAGYSSRPSPGYGWDSSRFTEADLPSGEALALTPLQRQVAGVTDIPSLSKEQYGMLLDRLAKDVNAHPFHRTETSKRVRDACQEGGVAVGRASINYVIQGLLYAGLKLQPPLDVQQLAKGWADNVVGLCRGARMEIGEDGLAEVRSWVGGGVTTPV